ncbi:MAG: GNAT family N-acetyltransferase [Clostridia bacterium]|nr:GNAT family N-acetyltransferase [Clostridia bacterium]
MSDGLRFAEKSDIPALCDIWEVCFNDIEDYVRFFYRENFDFVTTSVYAVDGRPASMLHWFDACFVDGDKRRKAKYLYAGGTLPEYRKNGYYGAVIRYVLDYADKNGYALFGKPANQPLIPYYRTFGFISDACFKLLRVSPGGRIPLKTGPISPEEYNRMRNNAFRSHPHVEWPDRYVRYCFAENEFLGGRTLALEMDGEDHFLMGDPQGKVLRIAETDLSAEQLRRAGGALCELFGTASIEAYMPDFSCGEGEEIVSSVIYNAPLCNTYVNLLLI